MFELGSSIKLLTLPFHLNRQEIGMLSIDIYIIGTTNMILAMSIAASLNRRTVITSTNNEKPYKIYLYTMF